MKEYILIKPEAKKSDAISQSTDKTDLSPEMSIENLEEYAQKFVNYDKIPIPKGVTAFLKVPHVRNGFDNSCSECSAEVIMRYWKIKNWNQFRMHREGYLTFEGKIAEGDRGLAKLFQAGHFENLDGKALRFTVKDIKLKDFSALATWIDRKVPIIVRIFTNKARGDQHTQVLVGYSKDAVFLNDNDVFSWKVMGGPHWIETRMDEFLDGWAGKCLIIYPKTYKW